jgi:hypothetical protein
VPVFDGNVAIGTRPWNLGADSALLMAESCVEAQHDAEGIGEDLHLFEILSLPCVPPRPGMGVCPSAFDGDAETVQAVELSYLAEKNLDVGGLSPRLAELVSIATNARNRGDKDRMRDERDRMKAEIARRP